MNPLLDEHCMLVSVRSIGWSWSAGKETGMRFTIEFLWNLGGVLIHVLPSALASSSQCYRLIGRGEGWKIGDSLYYGFITALTIGYGDFRTVLTEALAIVIGLFGLITTGILVAVALEVLSMTFESWST
jgi:hypothetical protein